MVPISYVAFIPHGFAVDEFVDRPSSVHGSRVGPSFGRLHTDASWIIRAIGICLPGVPFFTVSWEQHGR